MRAAQKQASQAADTAKQTGAQLMGNAGDLYKSLTPQLQQMATNPQGYGASDLAAANTASQQSTGGALSAVQGEQGLGATRTRNAGAGQAALDEAARGAMRTNSQNAVRTQTQNAELKNRQQQSALSSLGGLYGENLKGALGAMGLIPEDINAEVKAGQSGWYQNLLAGIQALKPFGSSGPGGGSIGFG